MYYYGLSSNSIFDTIKYVLWQAKEEFGCDAFSCLDIMENDKQMCLEQLNFIPGDALTHYYLVNYSMGDITLTPKDVAVIHT